VVTVKLFGVLRIDSGMKELCLEAGTVREIYPLLLRAIREKQPDSPLTEKNLRGCMAAVDGRQLGPRAKLRDGDVVCLFPPAAGG